MKQPTKEVVRLQFHKLEKSLMRTAASFDPEDIHVFRVEFKKLRAFLRLCGKRRASKGKVWRALRSFYRVTGKIRNIQLQQQRVRETWKHKPASMPRAYLSLLNLDITSAMLSARQFARKKIDISRERRSLLAILPDHAGNKSIRHFVLGTMRGLGALTSPPDHFSDEDIHSIRKLLKDVQYNLPYLETEMAILSPHLPAGGESVLEPMTDMLGEFQDICSSLALLNPCYLQRICDEAEKAVLRGWKAEIEMEKEQCRKRICNLLEGSGNGAIHGQLCVARNGMITYER